MYPITPPPCTPVAPTCASVLPRHSSVPHISYVLVLPPCTPVLPPCAPVLHPCGICKIRRIFYEKRDYASIRKYLNTVDWDEILSGKDTQQQYDTLIEIVKLCEEKYIPSKTVEKKQ